MNEPSTATSGDEFWLKAFPGNENEPRQAVAFLSKTWNDVVPRLSHLFKLSMRENNHTEVFAYYLQKYSKSIGRLTGFWENESPFITMENDETPQKARVSDRRRKDIVYLSNINGTQLIMIFEFKKITASRSSWSAYCKNDGMLRFITGNYAIGLPFAVMVGMVIGDPKLPVQSLQRCIESARASNDLCLVTRFGKVIIEPSLLFPGVCTFDTEHNRPPTKGPAHGKIILSHLFVQMPPPDDLPDQCGRPLA